MARISVEQKALTDPRFRLLGNMFDPLAKVAKETIERAYGLYLAELVWNECTERGVYELHPSIVEGICDGLADAMVAADLAEWTKKRGSNLRIKGTVGRTDWKIKSERNGLQFGHLGAEHGKKGGRPRKEKTPKGVSENPSEGLLRNPPLTPTPSNANSPSNSENTQSLRASETVPKWLPELWRQFWQAYPKKSYQSSAQHAFEMLLTTAPDPQALFVEIMSGLDCWKQSDEWARSIINNPHTWLNEKRFRESPEAKKEKPNGTQNKRTAARYDPAVDG